MTFGRVLRQQRQMLGLSQDQLGEELGVTKATISAWEGDKKLPESSRLVAIRAALNTSLDELFEAKTKFGAGSKVAEERSTYRVPSEEDWQLLQASRHLTRPQRAALVMFLDALLGK